MSLIEIDITRHAGPWPNTDQMIKESVETAAKQNFDAEPCELSIVLADNDFIQNLNRQYRGKDKPTNVLSFPQDDHRHLGDIILAYETIIEEATAQKKSFEDHLTHLVIHGFLHLLGYDHETETEAQEMESLEIKILGDLGVKNPYDDGHFTVES